MLELVAKIVETQFTTGWNCQTPVKLEKVPFRQPSNGEWVSLTVRAGLTRMFSPTIERQLGAVIFQIFQPKNNGTRRAEKLSDDIGDIFRGQLWAYGSDGEGGVNTDAVIVNSDDIPIIPQTDVETGSPVFSILFRSPVPIEVGNRPNYYQKNVSIPYLADRILFD